MVIVYVLLAVGLLLGVCALAACVGARRADEMSHRLRQQLAREGDSSRARAVQSR